jgi:hypothetical protein
MKKIIFLIPFTVFIFSCSNLNIVRILYGKSDYWTEISKNEVPEIIIEEFAEKLTKVTPEKYYRIGKKHFAIKYIRNGLKQLAVYSKEGVLKTEDTDFDEDEQWDDDDLRDYDLWD